jgi:DNA-binding response OmpR family regulator
LNDIPHLIIADYHLADGSNGVAATRIVREVLGADVPAFVVTADTSKILQEVEALENSRSMNKPISPELLLRLAREAIEAGRA